jgi:hypothetical protein
MDLSLTHVGDRTTEGSLNRIQSRLNLPAMILGPVIGDRQFDRALMHDNEFYHTERTGPSKNRR